MGDGLWLEAVRIFQLSLLLPALGTVMAVIALCQRNPRAQGAIMGPLLNASFLFGCRLLWAVVSPDGKRPGTGSAAESPRQRLPPGARGQVSGVPRYEPVVRVTLPLRVRLLLVLVPTEPTAP
jgi:hypothetical protein